MKSLRLERIRPDAAKAWLERRHPLGAGRAFTVALGLYWRGRLEGVLTLGNPICNNAGRFLGLQQYELAELHKMHVSDAPPRNCESRALAVLAILVRKHWPGMRALITYCDSDEAAAAYKGAGWVRGKTNRYVRDVKIGGKWLTVRNANRVACTKQATEKRYECRTKWYLLLDPTLHDAALTQRQSTGPPARV